MTHDEMNTAVRKSLLADEGRESHRGVYPKRRPIVAYEKPETVENLSQAAEGREDPDFPGCRW